MTEEVKGEVDWGEGGWKVKGVGKEAGVCGCRAWLGKDRWNR